LKTLEVVDVIDFFPIRNICCYFLTNRYLQKELMIKILKKNQSILIFLIIFLMQGNFGQIIGQNSDTTENKQVIQTDQSKLKVEPVPHKKIEDFRNNNAFKYDKAKMPGIDFWSIFWYWVNKILEEIFSDSGPAPYIRYLVMLLVIAFVVYKIFGGNFSGLFSRNKKIQGKNGFEYFEEDIYQQDLDEKLSIAIQSKNYREAIRFYYIKLLKELDINKLIKWEAGKTNRDYQKELSKNPIFENFISLSGIYEYSWYGHFEVDENRFQNWQSSFLSAFKNMGKK